MTGALVFGAIELGVCLWIMGVSVVVYWAANRWVRPRHEREAARRERAATARVSCDLSCQGQVRDLGGDPLDPHGDGTLRPGDPMFEQFMDMFASGQSIIANRRDDGLWDVGKVDPPQGTS